MTNYEELHVRMKNDREHGWVDNLLEDIRKAPLVKEESIDLVPDVGSKPAVTEDLTEDQRLVLMYTSRGLREQEIVDVTRFSKTAVRHRLQECRSKLAGKTTTHAVANAIRLNLIP